MRVFVTGAAGWIGSAVVAELIAGGHQVVGLSRSASNTGKLEAMGATIHTGDLTDLDSLKSGAASCDATIHLAFLNNEDFSNWASNCAKDKAAIEAMGEALQGTGKQLIVTAGMTIVPTQPGGVATEADPYRRAVPRVATEDGAAEVAKRGGVVSVVRLPPSVYGEGDIGFMATLIKAARAKGVSPYVGEGKTRWPVVHRFDAAKLYRLAVETQGQPGVVQIYHAVGEQGVAFRDVAETIGRVHSVPSLSIKPEEAKAHFGFLETAVQADLASSSTITQERLGWKPTEPGIIDALQKGSYATGATAPKYTI